MTYQQMADNAHRMTPDDILEAVREITRRCEKG